jgi:hypothetical protein
MVHDGMNSNCGPSAMKWRIVCPEVPDCPNWRDGLSARPRRTNIVYVWIWVKNGLSGRRGWTGREAREQNTCFWRFLTVGNGPSDLVGWTVRGSAENHRQARQWRLWPWFLGMPRCDSKWYIRHALGFESFGPSMVIGSWEGSRS